MEMRCWILIIFLKNFRILKTEGIQRRNVGDRGLPQVCCLFRDEQKSDKNFGNPDFSAL